MLKFKVENVYPLLEATSLFAEFAKEADVKFKPWAFSIIASHPSPRFHATLQISHHFFTKYSVDHNHSARTSLRSFHDALLADRDFDSITFHLLETLNQITLTFKTSTRLWRAPPLQHHLPLLPSQEERLDKIVFGMFFVIKSEDLRRVLIELPILQDNPVCVTLTDSQVKFCIASKEIILTKKDRQCTIVGYEGVETQFQIVLQPLSFFLLLSYKAERLWFYRTTNSHNVISLPAFGMYAQYVIYFPPNVTCRKI